MNCPHCKVEFQIRDCCDDTYQRQLALAEKVIEAAREIDEQDTFCACQSEDEPYKCRWCRLGEALSARQRGKEA